MTPYERFVDAAVAEIEQYLSDVVTVAHIAFEAEMTLAEGQQHADRMVRERLADFLGPDKEQIELKPEAIRSAKKRRAA